MYAEWTNQFIQIARYVFAISVLMIMWPKFIFTQQAGDLVERLISRFIHMTLLLIIVGYILIPLQLFETLAILPILIVIAARSHIWKLFARSTRITKLSLGISKLFDWLEHKYDPKPTVQAFLKNKGQNVLTEIHRRISRVPQLLESVLITVVIILAGYIRFYNSIVHAAPAQSDGYVTLAGIKYIDQNILFYDGIYPQGFYMWLDYLSKFSFTDPLYILNYTGPLIAMLLMVGMYVAISRWTASRMAGLVTITIYGLLGSVISGDFLTRQAVTNSQEFAFIFVIPTIYFLHQWLRDRIRRSLIVGIAGMMIVGLVHTFAYVYLGIAVILLLLIYIPLTYRERFRPIWPVLIGGIASIIISVVPLALGLLFERTIHSSPSDLTTGDNSHIYISDLTVTDKATLFAVAIVLIWIIFHRRKIREFTGLLFASLFVFVTFALYYFGHLFTLPGGVALTSRSVQLWTMMIPVGIGAAVGILFRFFRQWGKNLHLEIIATVVMISAIIIFVPPKPIIPYKMQWNSEVEQYLKISNTYRPRTWMIISPAEEGHALVLGNGHHLDTNDLVSKYDPNEYPLTQISEPDYDSKIVPDLFIYYQKSVFRTSETFIYEKRQLEMKLLEQWLHTHEAVNPNLSIWYEDDHIRIYHIHQPLDEKARREQIWGKEEPR
jgi:hypothetical protein